MLLLQCIFILNYFWSAALDEADSSGDAENAGVGNVAPSSRGGKRAGRRVEGIQGH